MTRRSLGAEERGLVACHCIGPRSFESNDALKVLHFSNNAQRRDLLRFDLIDGDRSILSVPLPSDAILPVRPV